MTSYIFVLSREELRKRMYFRMLTLHNSHVSGSFLASRMREACLCQALSNLFLQMSLGVLFWDKKLREETLLAPNLQFVAGQILEKKSTPFFGKVLPRLF